MNNRTLGGGSDGMSAGNTLFLLFAVVGAMTAAGFVHYKRTQAQMRDQVRVPLCLCGLCVSSVGIDCAKRLTNENTPVFCGYK